MLVTISKNRPKIRKIVIASARANYGLIVARFCANFVDCCQFCRFGNPGTWVAFLCGALMQVLFSNQSKLCCNDNRNEE